MNARQTFQLNPVAFLVATTFAFACTNASALDVKPGSGLGDFEDGEHQFVGDELKEDLNIYGDFSNKTHEFTIHTANGTLHLNPIDKKEDRVLFVSNNSYFKSGKPIPQLTIEGNLTVDSFIGRSFPLTIQADPPSYGGMVPNNISTYAVIQAGSQTSGGLSSDKTSGRILIQGDLSISNVFGTSSNGSLTKFNGNAIYVGENSILDLTKKDGTVGNISITNSSFSSDVIDLGGSGSDSSTLSSKATIGNLSILDTKAEKAIEMLGGILTSNNITVTGGEYSTDILKFSGRKQAGGEKTFVTTGDITIDNVLLGQNAIYIGTSNPDEFQQDGKINGSVNADIGNITITNSNSQKSNGASFIYIRNNVDSSISIGDINIKNVQMTFHTNQNENGVIHFSNNKDVSLKNGKITIQNVSVDRAKASTIYSDKFAALNLGNGVNNLNELFIDNVKFLSMSDTNNRGPGYFSGLRLGFAGSQNIKRIDISNIFNDTANSKEEYGLFAPVSGIYQSDKKNSFTSDSIAINTVEGAKDTFGMNLKGTTNVSLIDIKKVTSKNHDAWGIHSEGVFSANQVFINGVKAENNALGLGAKQAHVDSLSIGGLTGKNTAAVLAYASSVAQDGVFINESKMADATVTIEGDLLVETAPLKNAKLTASLTNGNSYIKGATGFTNKNNDFVINESIPVLGGKLDINLDNKSRWIVTNNSYLTDLTINNDAYLDLVTESTADKWNKVTTKHLDGNKGILKLGINLGTESAQNVHATQLTVKDKALGSHIADIKIDGRDLVPEKCHSENWLVSQGANSNMSILNKDGTNQFSGNGMTTTWALAFVANGEEDKLNTAEGLTQLVGNTTGKGEGKWYLVRNDEEIVDPNPNPGPDPKPDPKPEQPKPNDPAEMQQITNLGISATQALSFASELEDLRGRLGEVRYGAQDGAWVRAGYTKETADGYNGRGFEQKTHDLHIGLDRIVAADEDSSWLVGGALRYAKSKQEGFTAARGGEGELEQYSAKLYVTYMHAQGSYADFVVQAGRYSQDLTGLANDLSSAFKADYKTYGYGASVEIGHMFDFNNQVDDRQWFNHFFIEPQLQLSYFNAHGKDYKTSTGLAVSQSDADFLTGRAGVVLGKKFNYGTADDLDKRYFQVGLKGGVKYEFLGDQTIRFTGIEGVTKERKADDVDGARYYYGVTADWQLSHNFRAYATVEREEGDHYTKDFDVSVGVKYQF